MKQSTKDIHTAKISNTNLYKFNKDLKFTAYSSTEYLNTKNSTKSSKVDSRQATARIIDQHHKWVTEALKLRYKKENLQHWTFWFFRQSIYLSFFPPLSLLLITMFILSYPLRRKERVTEGFIISKMIEYNFEKVIQNENSKVDIQMKVMLGPKKGTLFIY